MNEKFCILNRLSRKLVTNGLIDDIPELFQIMAWRWSGDKPLSELMLTQFTDAYMQHWGILVGGWREGRLDPS